MAHQANRPGDTGAAGKPRPASRAIVISACSIELPLRIATGAGRGSSFRSRTALRQRRPTRAFWPRHRTACATPGLHPRGLRQAKIRFGCSLAPLRHGSRDMLLIRLSAGIIRDFSTMTPSGRRSIRDIAFPAISILRKAGFCQHRGCHSHSCPVSQSPWSLFRTFVVAPLSPCGGPPGERGRKLPWRHGGWRRRAGWSRHSTSDFRRYAPRGCHIRRRRPKAAPDAAPAHRGFLRASSFSPINRRGQEQAGRDGVDADFLGWRDRAPPATSGRPRRPWRPSKAILADLGLHRPATLRGVDDDAALFADRLRGHEALGRNRPQHVEGADSD